MVDQKNDSRIKQIFLVLDNSSIHKSNKVKEILTKYHHRRIQLVFLPTRSPELNRIEVRWLCWMHRQAVINNSTFENEQDIGKAIVSDWICDYDKNHII
jgi:transposase